MRFHFLSQLKKAVVVVAVQLQEPVAMAVVAVEAVRLNLPPITNMLLNEDGSFFLCEDGSYLLFE